MDIPINARTRTLILRYEHDRPVSEDTARDALIGNGIEGDRDVIAMVLHPYDRNRIVRTQKPEDWAWAFHENERFADALLQKETELGLNHLPVHLFGCAPLVLMLHLASCLQRRPLHVYQQAPDGTWSLGYDRARPPAPDDFFQVEGLPAARQGGRGQVALIVEVTKSIKDKAFAEFQSRHSAGLLTTVSLRPTRGPSPTSVRDPSEVSRAVEQFRSVLDTLHERLEGAESVLLAMDCPASFAAALATAINPNTQHPLWLHHFNPEQDSYLLVHRIHPRRRGGPAQATSPTLDEYKEASKVLEKVRAVHESLLTWLAKPKQKSLAELLGGKDLLESRINPTPASETTPVFRYLDGSWTFEVGLLQGLARLRERLGSTEDWEECIRVFFAHEAYHVRQRGPTSYNYSGSGRTGWVLEAVDYDADELSFQVALAWRLANKPATARTPERTRALEAILWNALEFGRVFEQERPLRELPERRLRRYLIWLFHACRLGTPAVRRTSTTRLDRVTVEIAGLPSFPDPFESYNQQRVRLEGLDGNEPLGVAIYYRRQLAREMNTAWVTELLQALSRWDEWSCEKAHEAVKLLFERFFDRHRFLLESEEGDSTA
jgi:hypothetical protein